NQCFGMNWNEMFDDYKTILSNESILQEQHQTYVLSQAPIIADKRIKEIPIHENGEELVDLKVIKHERIHMLPDLSTPFEAACFNSGLPSASKMRAGICCLKVRWSQ